jgi:predicted nucleic acid-binding protein
MTPEAATRAIPMDEFISENWDYFGPFEAQAENRLTQLSREMPAGLYESIRDRLFELMVLAGLKGKLKVKAVIDSDIVVGDAIRVARGKESSTERILSTTFIECLAPLRIVEEVERNIRKKINDDEAVEKALTHARRLLSHVRIVSQTSIEAMTRASQLLLNHQKDAPFLAVLFEVEADAVISREMGTYDKPGVNRWTLGKTVEVIVSYESGSLALVLLGAAIEALVDAFASLLLIVLRAVEEALIVILNLVKGLVEGSVESIKKIPQWVWYAIGVAGAATLVGAVLHEGFRNWLISGIAKIRATLSSFISGIIEMAKSIWQALKQLLVLVWNTLLPLTASAVIIGGVLIRRLCRLITMSRALAEEPGA